MNCRLCSSESELLGRRDDVALYRCPRCAFVSGQPASSLPLEAHYEHTYSGPAAPDPLARYGEWLARAETLVEGRRLLEIGAGGGGFVKVAAARGWETHATETSPSGLEALRAAGVTVFEGELPRLGLSASSYDLVVALEVLEHLPDPLAYLQEAHRVLKPGGVLVLTTPNYDGLSRRWLGLRWRVVSPEHVGYFTGRTLARALSRAAYRQVRVRSRSLNVSTWRRAAAAQQPAAFDPQASARLRDSVEAKPWLRTAKEGVNWALGLTGLGDSLLAWARR